MEKRGGVRILEMGKVTLGMEKYCGVVWGYYSPSRSAIWANPRTRPRTRAHQ